MARPKAPCGTYAAYRRHLREGTEVCEACREAKRENSRARSHSAKARREKQVDRQAARAAAQVRPTPRTDEGHVSRLETLRDMLQTSRELVAELRVRDPARAYLQMREQREILREIAEIQGNGQSTKGVTLEDQLAAARAEREQREAARSAGA
ncbi:hypothetical protein [Leucobacter massiliensis]|uniref:Uncharacterized protein n=1 Tax=Leucobacter massiliensis TaxID=1686285 RepID=A0A2S9QQP1_9MICO|nr:hypothetical protein [Leucobacter massiliensis]PRI11892.1 hypothetical protein B4915_02105 [Leucobacter massiliensis]